MRRFNGYAMVSILSFFLTAALTTEAQARPGRGNKGRAGAAHGKRPAKRTVKTTTTVSTPRNRRVRRTTRVVHGPRQTTVRQRRVVSRPGPRRVVRQRRVVSRPRYSRPAPPARVVRRPPQHRRPVVRTRVVRPAPRYRRPVRVAVAPPVRAVRIHHAGQRYRYHTGRYWLLASTGWMRVAPPVGIVVPQLPYGYHTEWINGRLHYVFDGVYYLPVPNGFLVVDPAW